MHLLVIDAICYPPRLVVWAQHLHGPEVLCLASKMPDDPAEELAVVVTGESALAVELQYPGKGLPPELLQPVGSRGDIQPDKVFLLGPTLQLKEAGLEAPEKLPPRVFGGTSFPNNEPLDTELCTIKILINGSTSISFQESEHFLPQMCLRQPPQRTGSPM